MALSPSVVKHLPMMATYARIVLTPVIMLVLSNGFKGSLWVAIGLFMVASWTDWLDGFLARTLNAESNMGRFMDPIADKILVLGCLLVLLHQDKVGPWPVALLLGRDIYIGGLRSVAAADQVIISAKPMGKWKTALQMAAIPCLFIGQPLWGLPFLKMGTWGLWGAVALSAISGVQYAQGYYQGRS